LQRSPGGSGSSTRWPSVPPCCYAPWFGPSNYWRHSKYFACQKSSPPQPFASIIFSDGQPRFNFVCMIFEILFGLSPPVFAVRGSRTQMAGTSPPLRLYFSGYRMQAPVRWKACREFQLLCSRQNDQQRTLPQQLTHRSSKRVSNSPLCTQIGNVGGEGTDVCDRMVPSSIQRHLP
jgi:hypothetical protein